MYEMSFYSLAILNIFTQKVNPLSERPKIFCHLGSKLNNLNWEFDAEKVLCVIISQLPLHNQLYLEKQKRDSEHHVKSGKNVTGEKDA